MPNSLSEIIREVESLLSTAEKSYYSRKDTLLSFAVLCEAMALFYNALTKKEQEKYPKLKHRLEKFEEFIIL